MPRLWPGSTVVIIASGPSLTHADVDYCRGKAKVIAVNDNYRLAPWADALYAADLDWWTYHKTARPENQHTPWTVVAAPKYSIQLNRPYLQKDKVTPLPVDYFHRKHLPEVHVFRNAGMLGLETDPSALRHGKNSGAQAIGLAVHLGATRVLLLGYDCKPTGGEFHWFGHHPSAIRKDPPFSAFKHCFEQLAPELARIGVEVINCSRETALDCWPVRALEEALPASATVAA